MTIVSDWTWPAVIWLISSQIFLLIISSCFRMNSTRCDQFAQSWEMKRKDDRYGLVMRSLLYWLVGHWPCFFGEISRSIQRAKQNIMIWQMVKRSHHYNSTTPFETNCVKFTMKNYCDQLLTGIQWKAICCHSIQLIPKKNGYQRPIIICFSKRHSFQSAANSWLHWLNK